MNEVLIVDDSASLRQIVLGVLRRAPLSVARTYEAADGLEALEQLRAHPGVGLVLTDLDMPRVDGVELVRRVKEDYPNRVLAVIVMAPAGRDDERDAALACGADGFVTKPFGADELGAVVRSCAPGLALHDEVRER